MAQEFEDSIKRTVEMSEMSDVHSEEVETCVEALESVAEETIRYADQRQRRGRGSRYNEIRSLLR